MHTFLVQKQQNYFKKVRILLLIIKFPILRPESEIFSNMMIITSLSYLHVYLALHVYPNAAADGGRRPPPTQRQTAAEGREEAAAALFLKFRVQNDGPST